MPASVTQYFSPEIIFNAEEFTISSIWLSSWYSAIPQSLCSILWQRLPNQLNQFLARNSTLGPCLLQLVQNRDHTNTKYLRWSSLILTPNVHRLSLLLDLAVLRLSFPAFLRQPWLFFCYEWSLQACYGAPGAGCGGSRDQLGPSDKFKTNSASTVCWGGSSCHEIMSWYQRSYETCDELRCVVTIMKLCQVIHDSEDKNVTLWSIPRLLPPSSPSPSSPGYVASLWRSAESHTKYPSCHHRKLANKTSKSAQSQSLCYPPPSLYLHHGDSQALILTAGFSSDKI